MSVNATDNRMSKIVSLGKRRGYIFQSSEIYGGLDSCYDYGPLGVELKKNRQEDCQGCQSHRNKTGSGIVKQLIQKWQAA